MEEHIFCCDVFNNHVKLDKSCSINIKIIKLEKTNNSDLVNRVVMNSGYGYLNQSFGWVILRYCPFCGTDLISVMSNQCIYDELDADFPWKGNKKGLGNSQQESK